MRGNDDDDNNAYYPVDIETAVIEDRKKTTKIKRYQVIIIILAVAVIILLATFLSLYKISGHSHRMKSENIRVLNVFYAGSLVDVMNRIITPKLLSQYGIQINGTAAGSNALVTLLEKGATPDIFISADSALNVNIMNYTLPNSMKKVSTWYFPWTRSRLGIAYSRKSSHLDTFLAIENGSLAWYDAMTLNSGIRLGRTDPNTDPKGYRTVMMMELAETYYNVSNIIDNVIGSPNNRLQIFNEQDLENFLQEGAVDAGFFYESENDWSSDGIGTFIPLPAAIDFSDPSLNSVYSTVNSLFHHR
jgi:molybdate/tungstate transport system substrate-binding protein